MPEPKKLPTDFPRPREYVSMDWRGEAACSSPTVDTSWWFPERSGRPYLERALRYCNVCPVKQECLEYALESKEAHGIWGGLTDAERRVELKRRERQAATVGG